MTNGREKCLIKYHEVGSEKTKRRIRKKMGDKENK